MAQTTTTIRKLFDGKLRLERRNQSPMVYARTYLQGKSLVTRTCETTIGAATEVAKDWYVDLLQRVKNGEQLHGRPFNELAQRFLAHAERHRRVSAGQLEQYRVKLNMLAPYFLGKKVADIDESFLLELREQRSRCVTKAGTPVKPTTLKKDLIVVRLVLQYAKGIEKCITDVPRFPSFAGDSWRIVQTGRPFLSLKQWQKVRDLAKQRSEEEGLNPRTRAQRQELYWFLLMCVGAALRVGEAYSLRWQDCELVTLDDKQKTQAVHMWVLGKHSRGGRREEAWGLYGAVSAFKEMQKARPDVKPSDPLFKENHREGMKELLVAADLRFDKKEGMTRNAKSLRQTGISMRLDMGPDPNYRDIAKWARTSVAMVEQFYDQTHPEKSVERIAGFRPKTKRKGATDGRTRGARGSRAATGTADGRKGVPRTRPN
jgi:integrase